MLFNSFVFVLFFVSVYSLYVSLQKRFKWQNILLLVASYIFYGYWNWRFLLLLFISTVIDFTIGQLLDQEQDEKKRKIFLAISVCANLSILGFFKYFNFFAGSFIGFLNTFGMKADELSIKIILPVGISFYTFQTMSYTIDIYRKKLKPTRDFNDFALFVSFFPQLVAGPIERAVNLLPQIASNRILKKEQIDAGLFLIVWGYFKKVVVADHMAIIANQVFNNYTDFQGLDILVGILAFTFQIYGDFSGYSDIARGISKLMGFDLMVNFKLPYFAKNPSDFWSRWHISLSSWLRDYLYISLGGNRNGNFKTYRNLLVTMVLGGLWHGAAWNFVVWGCYHGFLLIVYRLFGIHEQIKETRNLVLNWIKNAMLLSLMFIFTLIGWVIFRSRSVDQIIYMLSHITFEVSPQTISMIGSCVFFVTPLIIVQIWQHSKKDLLVIPKLSNWFRIPIYSLLVLFIFLFGIRESMEFIYFQF